MSLLKLVAKDVLDDINQKLNENPLVQIGRSIMATKDKYYGLSPLIDEAVEVIEEVLNKYEKVMHPNHVEDLNDMLDYLDEVSNLYDTGETQQVPPVEAPLNPSNPKDVVIEAEVVKPK